MMGGISMRAAFTDPGPDQPLLTCAARRPIPRVMDLDELFPDKPDDPLTLLTKQDLDPLSVDELHARIAILEAEIARVKAKLENAVNFRSTADELFKR